MTGPVMLVATRRWFPTARLAMALANAGCRVEAVCSAGHPLGLTGAVQRIHAYSDLTPVRSIARAIRASNPELVIPGDDLATRHLHDLHSRELRDQRGDGTLGSLIERSLGAATNFPAVFARSGFMEVAREEGVRVPHTEVIAHASGLEAWAASKGFPAVLKANETSGGSGVRVVRSLAEAKRAFHVLQSPPLLARAVKRALLDRDGTLLAPSLLRRRFVVNAQAFVVGREATSAVACWKGEVRAAIHFEVVQKTASSGHATVVRQIENPEMIEAAEKMVRRLGLSGLHGFDFMLETETGRAFLIELNPRATQVGHLALGAGRDLPAALYAAVSGLPVHPAPAVTKNEIIALFPQEWIRDSSSPLLQLGFHDVPWQAPDLVNACVRSRSKQSAWYSREKKVPEDFRDSSEAASSKVHVSP